MKFLYTYRTPDNKQHRASIKAASKEAAYAALKAQGIKPGHVDEAPGFFNKLFGKGKRWIAIGVLCALCAVLCAVVYTQGTRHEARGTIDAFLDSPTRRQVIGDTAVIERGIATGWADVFALEGERFLASFAVPGVPAGQRSTTEEEIKKVLSSDSSLVPHPASLGSDGLEARQIRAMVEGMKEELREFLADGGTIVEYGKRLVQRQEVEIGYYNRAKAEIEASKKAGAHETAILDLWTKRNASLRRMGIKLLPMPE